MSMWLRSQDLSRIPSTRFLPGISRGCEYLRFIFAYTGSMFHAPTFAIHPFVIACKGCHENIHAPVETLPGSWIVAECPHCGERRRYLPADIFQGRLSHELVAKPHRSRSGGEKRAR
jgi:hypothetical protein